MNLGELCRSWQQRLGLQDWHISIVPAAPYKLGREEQTAEIHWELGTKYAQVSVLDAAHVADDLIAPHDPEQALVHELLHLHFAPFAAPVHKAKGVAQEQAINAIAAALVALARTSAPPTPEPAPWGDPPVADEILPGIWRVLGTKRCWLLMRIDGGYRIYLHRDLSGVWTHELSAPDFDLAVNKARSADEAMAASRFISQGVDDA